MTARKNTGEAQSSVCQDQFPATDDRSGRRARSYIRILEELGWTSAPEQRLVDFGCGAGRLVREFRQLGYNTFGCDIEFPDDALTRQLRQADILRVVSGSPYHLPFDSNSIDVVISDEVMEHVADYPAGLGEIHRILRPGGVCLHIFPSRYRFVEPHALVPLATIIRTRWWLWIWAFLGVRNEFQAGVPSREVVDINWRYLRERTFYLRKKQLRAEFQRFFPVVIFCEDRFLRQSERAQVVLRRVKSLRSLSFLYSAFRSRVVYARK